MEYLTIFATFLSALGTFITGWATWNIYRVSQQQQAITERQQRPEEVRLKHELYDRRYAVYQACKELLGNIMREADVNRDALPNFIRGTADCDFLFQDEIREYVQEVYAKAAQLYTKNLQLREGNLPVGEARRGLLMKFRNYSHGL